MRAAVIALATLVVLGGTARAEVRKGPYLQAVTPTGITVMWQAEPAVSGRVIVEGPGLPADGKTIEVPAGSIARAVIEGLRPASRYRYRVEIGDARDGGEFATAPEPGAATPFAFVAFGDNGGTAERHRRIVDAVATEGADFILATGDLVIDAGKPELWQTLFEVERPLLRDTVMVPALGNHDARSHGRRVDTFRSLFTLPGVGDVTDDAAPLYRAFSYGRSRFVILDSNLRGGALADETGWLERELGSARADPAIDHIFVTMHHPLYSVSRHGGKPVLREQWAPLFARYGVAAVFCGHDHVYERAEAGGVHYFVSGGGGASLYARRPHPAAIDATAVERLESVHHYLRVDVDGGRIEVAAIRDDGTTIETTAWGERHPPAVAPASPAAPGPQAGSVTSIARPRRIGGLEMAGAAGVLLASLLLMRALRRD